MDLTGISGESPVFTDTPNISNGSVQTLDINGYYPLGTQKLVFQLKYYSEDNNWKLLGINVNLQ